MSTKPDRPRRKQRGGSLLGMAWEDESRAKIKGSKTLNRLISFVEGEISLDPHQVTAAGILLRKILPDLSASENKNETTVRYVARIPNKATSSEEWQQQHEQPTLQ
jgi:hypothetical protein